MTTGSTGNKQESEGKDGFRLHYEKFDLYKEIRQETWDEDIGQTSWMTADEQRRFVSWLDLAPENWVLDVASGSGGPSLNLAILTGCNIIGIDIAEEGIAKGNTLARNGRLNDQVRFEHHDASQPLPYDSEKFDAIICIDSICHLPDRQRILADWKRVLKVGGRLIYTDPFVVTGALSNEEIATRSTHGYCLFIPPGKNEQLIKETGFELLIQEDVTENVPQVSSRWFAARAKREEALRHAEGDALFETVQDILNVSEIITREGRLSHFVYVAEKSS